jgi:hypothetical protein
VDQINSFYEYKHQFEQQNVTKIKTQKIIEVFNFALLHMSQLENVMCQDFVNLSDDIWTRFY